MKIKLITIGKLKSGPCSEIAQDYIKRINHYSSIELVPVKNDEELLKKINPDEFLIVLDEQGKELTSKGFAKFLEEKQNRSERYLTFAVGGAEGWSRKVKEKANYTLALSKFTLQHDLAALVLLEQIYRSFSIIKGEPYHK